MMNRHNAKMNGFALQQLELTTEDRVLEIGFGGGATLPKLMLRAAFVAGVDRSHAMVARARADYAQPLKAGRADFREGTVEELPFDTAAFSKVCTVNTIYFWKSLEAGFAEIHRVLVPGGRVVVGFLPKERMDRMGMPADIFTSRALEDVAAALEKQGFVEVLVTRPQPTTLWVVIVASRLVN